MNKTGLSFHRILLNDIGHYRGLFRKTVKQDQEKAIRYLNRDKLTFPQLFILLPEIETANLSPRLNSRNILALKICAEKSENKTFTGELEKLATKDPQTARKTLKWMFYTGLEWEGPKEDYDPYDEVLDAVTALLITRYQEKSILPVVADLIFRRHRKGLYIHDLVWSFFRAYDPSSFHLIARYLRSDNEKDVELACKILHLNPDLSESKEKQKRFRDYHTWLADNKPYLYLTGESFQYTSEPVPIDIDLEAKYLRKKISPRSREPLTPLTEAENAILDLFDEVPPEDQIILSEYSHQIHKKDKKSWNRWIQNNIRDQIAIAKADREVDE